VPRQPDSVADQRSRGYSRDVYEGQAVLGSLVSVSSALIGGMRAGLVIAGSAFLVGAALVSGLAREPG
jgi:hypothetical protein